MNINAETVEYIAKLARISISEEEKSRFVPQLTKIITYVEKLNELDTEGVSPMSSVIPVKNVFREDEAKPSMPRDEVLANAPCSQNGFFKVPKVI